MATVNQLGAGIAWEKPADLSSRDVQKRLGPSAVKAFLKIRELWELRDEDARQLLGGISNGAFYELKKKARGTLDQDRLTRISILTGIFKGLNILYSKKLACFRVLRCGSWSLAFLTRILSTQHSRTPVPSEAASTGRNAARGTRHSLARPRSWKWHTTKARN